MERSSTNRVLGGFERLLLLIGLFFLAVYAAARIYGALYSRSELRRFWGEKAPVATFKHRKGEPDFRLWSGNRVASYESTLSSNLSPPLAVLRIPILHLEVPVLEGTEELTLNRAVGHIEGTASPGEGGGNIGIAGHRDGFFRGLKDIHQGDAIDLFTDKQSVRYIVDEILIVPPENVMVLQPRSRASLTLVTCYPFYFVGSAPLRFIVHASVVSLVPDERPG
jgi:sortase A